MYSQKSSGTKAADQRLMCVWQTVHLLDPNHSATYGTARKVTVKEVTSSLARSCRLVHYTQMGFQDNFPHAVVNFEDFVNYVKVCIRDYSVPFARVEEEFEVQSWEICKESYGLHHCSVMEGEVFKLWQIFNRLCVPGSMPPVMHFDDVQWLGIKFTASSKQRWSVLHDGQLTFLEFLNDLDAMCFKSLSHGDVERTVSSVHSWLVDEICLAGWMTKRTRKQASWTNLHKRWFVLKPGVLTYYTNATLSDRKGDIILNNKSTVDDMQDLKTLLRSYPNRFRITNAPFIEIELICEDMASKDQWMSEVMLVIRAAKLGLSPSQVKLADIRKQYAFDHRSNDDSSLLPRLRSDGEDEDEDEMDGARSSATSATENGSNDSARSSSSEESKMDFCFIISTIDKLFEDAKSACDGEDSFSLDHFKAYIDGKGLDMSEDDTELLFDTIRADDETDLAIEVYIRYLVHLLLFEEVPSEPSVRLFLSRLLNQKDVFKEKFGQLEVFIEKMWHKQRLHYVKKLNDVLNRHEPQGEDVLTMMREAFSREQSILGTILDSTDAEKARDLETLYSQMKMSTDDLSAYLYEKWEAYPYKGDPEKHPNRISQDTSLLDVVFYSDVVTSVPEHTAVEDFKWKRPSREGKLGVALFPYSFDEHLCITDATPEALMYYGASLADQSQIDTSLIYLHSPTVFVQSDLGDRPACLHYYQKEGIFLGPLEEESGVLILGKQDGNVLRLSGFRIPAFASVYIPRNTIYCVDYTQGLWRKMINVRTPGDHAQILIKASDDPDEENTSNSDEWLSNVRKCSFEFVSPV